MTQIPEDDCFVQPGRVTDGENGRRSHTIVMLSRMTSHELIFDTLVGYDLARYRASFVSHPSSCTECGHVFTFDDRVAAGIILGVHDKDFILKFLSDGPAKREFLKGVVYCEECQALRVVQLQYAYPAFMLSGREHEGLELASFGDVTIETVPSPEGPA